MTAEEKAWIDEACYEDLLRKWRFAPAGSPWFQGDTGQYYAKVMDEKKAAIGREAVNISKRLG